MAQKPLATKSKDLLQPRNKQSKYPQFWIGTWSMGGEHFGSYSTAHCEPTLTRAFTNGIRHYDSAFFYAHGHSERHLSKFLSNIERESVYISSKGGLSWNRNNVQHTGNRKDLKETLYTTLEILQTDYLDLYSLHWPDPTVEFSESINALRELKEEGVVRHIGVSNCNSDQLSLLASENIPHQLHFNPLHRSTENLLNASTTNIVYSPLEQGLLSSGQCGYGPLKLGKKDIRRRNPLFKNNSILKWRDQFHELTLKQELPKEVIVYLWILAYPNVSGIISGARTVSQLNQTLSILEWLNTLDLNLNKRETWKSQLPELFGKEIYSHLERGPS